MFKTRLLAGTMAVAVSLSAATPALAWYRRPGPGPGLALGILGGIVAGAAIAHALRPPSPPPTYYVPPQPTYAPPPASAVADGGWGNLGVHAPPPSYYEPDPAYQTPAYGPAAGAHGTTEIALSGDGSHGGYHTVAYVNGAPVNFEVDTGADTVYLPWSIASSIVPVGAVRGTTEDGVAGGAPLKVLKVRLASITLGGHTVYNVEAQIGPGGDALLGQTFFRHFASETINNTRHTLLLGPQTSQS